MALVRRVVTCALLEAEGDPVGEGMSSGPGPPGCVLQSKTVVTDPSKEGLLLHLYFPKFKLRIRKHA